MNHFLEHNATSIIAWCGAFCTVAIYSVLYGENKLYRFMEHLFIGLGAGYGLYITWSEVLYPKWWTPMVHDHKWVWIYAAVAGLMFYFVYSRKHFWISRVIFGAFMGLASGGIFREFYEIYFPQIRSSMKPVTGTPWEMATAIIFYIILFSCMSYFFFSFEHKNKFIKSTSSLGRWLLMIGFGSIFGVTIMGRLTLFIGRFNFLVNEWFPEVKKSWDTPLGMWIILGLSLILAAILIIQYIRRPKNPETV